MTETTPPPGQESRFFGFREVDPREKTPLVRGVFSSVATRYDLMNDLMSGGIHRLWKDSFVSMVDPRPGETLLDVAGGTGDIAFRLSNRAPGSRVLVCDLTEAMVRVGRDRAIDRGLPQRSDGTGIDWMVGNAEALPIASRSVDAYTIAFGLRNVTHIDVALAEARRVLKPGGRLFILEFSHVTLPIFREIYDGFSFGVLPRLGEMVAGDRESYQYLVESIRRFPRQEALCRRIEAAGLARVRYRNLTGGIAAVHSAWRV
ncbi:class I SAM-dependent methyltransferase [Rhodospirillum centenum]|uniref:Ubiquinone/menaquinone biosynthesis C-methyltransferase UbiE n=1 Tax=Rhodospirillum centenum (strain ATCC 51521 / SW) TaxID=414684 RepID=B6IWF6_RHOCS|nr:class I SAM-dependent methyltransferase [Rhodospirillum centenum]ACJ00630.1 ubiquinone [Rhodospirillum centenum SW]